MSLSLNPFLCLHFKVPISLEDVDGAAFSLSWNPTRSLLIVELSSFLTCPILFLRPHNPFFKALLRIPILSVGLARGALLHGELAGLKTCPASAPVR